MSLSQWLLFPVFVITLLGEVAANLSQLIWDTARRPLALAIAIGFFFLVLIWRSGTLVQFLSPRPLQNSPDKTAATSNSLLQQQLLTWEKMYQLQPTHRDVLLNIARLQEALGQASAAAEFREAARQVDPNSPLVQ